MIKTSVSKALLGAAISVAAAVGGAGSAHAAVYTGTWDPNFGAYPFTDLEWAGTATFFIPDECVISTGIVTSCSFGSLTAGPATLDFTSLSYPLNTEHLVLNQQVGVSQMVFQDGQLVGVDSALFAPVLANSTFAGNGNYSFSLQFTSTSAGTKLFYAKNHGEEWDDEEEDDATCHFPATSDGNTRNCGVNNFGNQPAKVTYTLVVPEPQTYALMLAGLGAVGFIARRRRRA